MAKVTVVIPSYNHAKFIGAAIQSVLEQTFQDFEILIRDDGSTDNSIEIIQQFSDPRINVAVNAVNMGGTSNLNKLIEEANGEYIALLNSDDYWLPTKLEKQVNFLENNPEYGAVFTRATVIEEDGSLLENINNFYYNIFDQQNRSRQDWLNYFYYNGNCLCHPSVLVRAGVYREIGSYDRLMSSLPDFDMWVRICLKYQIYILEDKLTCFRILNNEQNTSSATNANYISCQFEYKQILDNFVRMNKNDYKLVFGIDVKYDVEFDMALLAINMTDRFRQDWGLSILRKRLLTGDSILTDKEFTNLTKKLDIYNIIELKGKEAELKGKDAELKEKILGINILLKSYSWRITKPLRFLKNILSNFHKT